MPLHLHPPWIWKTVYAQDGIEVRYAFNGPRAGCYQASQGLWYTVKASTLFSALLALQYVIQGYEVTTKHDRRIKIMANSNSKRLRDAIRNWHMKPVGPNNTRLKSKKEQGERRPGYMKKTNVGDPGSGRK